MNVVHMKMVGLMSYASTEVRIPPHGVVVVTGANGVGKSAIIEGVAVALWGETLRGTDPWAGENGSVELETAEGLHVVRTRKKGKISLSFWTGDEKPVKYENTTKAQAALDLVVGGWDVWKRSSVFSSQDAAHFSLAPDATRKRLLESVLGIDRFDTALEACRKDLKVLDSECTRAENEMTVLKTRIAGEDRRAEDAKGFLASEPEATGDDPAALEAEVKRLRALLTSTDQEIGQLRSRSATASQSTGELAATISALKRALERLQAEKCPTCTQAIPRAMREDLAKKIAAEEAEAASVGAGARTELAAIASQLEELDEERDHLRQRAQDTQAKADTARSARSRRERAQRIVDEVQAEVAKLRGSLTGYTEKRDKAVGELAVLRAVEKALGTKGVRAHVLSRALGGLEAAANAWLGRIAGEGVALSITPYTEKSGGGVKDSISLEVTGFGHGEGYKGSSGGQRRRVDVALVLALGEVAAAAHGVLPGTLFADEVFDTLDREGVERVSASLHELAEDRAVLVISHNEDLVDSLRADAHWTVDDGRIHGG